jgi:hypothetical protein
VLFFALDALRNEAEMAISERAAMATTFESRRELFEGSMVDEAHFGDRNEISDCAASGSGPGESLGGVSPPRMAPGSFRGGRQGGVAATLGGGE